MTERFTAGGDLDTGSAAALFDEMIATTDETALVDLFHAWDRKGIAADEIYSLAKVLRERCVKVSSRHEPFVDIVGTGGSSAKTFNVSTAAAFVVAGSGLAVAKHGNRAATSNSGSADVLAELGVAADIDADLAERCLNEVGICFMYAPKHHRLSPTLASARRRLGFPTIFNCVGPLSNPADVPHQVIGVWSRGLVAKMAEALSRFGTTRSWIVNGHDKLDEISVTGRTTISDVNRDTFKTFEVTANEIGIDSFTGDLPMGCSARESAQMIRAILDNEMKDRDAEKLVLLNAAAAIYIAGRADSLGSAYTVGMESIRSNSAAAKLKELAQATR